MPAEQKNGAPAGKSERAQSKPQSKSKEKPTREPSLRDLRRRLVGLRYDLLRRLMVTMVVIGSAGLIASSLNPGRLAREYPAALADGGAAMTALATNTHGALGHLRERVVAMLPSSGASAAGPVTRIAFAGAAVAHPVRNVRETAHRVAHKRAVTPLAKRVRRAASHYTRASHGHPVKVAATLDTATPGISDGDVGNWLVNEAPAQFNQELSKAYYKFLDFASNVIELNWAPELRDSLSNSMQSMTDQISAGGGFSMSDLVSLLKSIAGSSGMLAVGAGLLLFSLMVGMSAWLRRAANG